MNVFKFINERTHRFGPFELKLLQLSAIMLALVIVKLLPSIMEINIWWFAGLAVLFALRPLYIFFRNNSN